MLQFELEEKLMNIIDQAHDLDHSDMEGIVSAFVRSEIITRQKRIDELTTTSL